MTEADPENYDHLKVNRDRSINVHGALCSEPRLLHYSSLGVLPVRGFIEFMSPSFLKKWHGKIYNNKTRVDELPTVQCLPVKTLLRELRYSGENLLLNVLISSYKFLTCRSMWYVLYLIV
jgi:hypothetical protein